MALASRLRVVDARGSAARGRTGTAFVIFPARAFPLRTPHGFQAWAGVTEPPRRSRPSRYPSRVPRDGTAAFSSARLRRAAAAVESTRRVSPTRRLREIHSRHALRGLSGFGVARHDRVPPRDSRMPGDGAGDGVVRDSRFKALHNDPRFMNFPAATDKTKIDGRFAKMFSDPNFGTGARGNRDKRGRRTDKAKRKSAADDLKRYYDLEEEEEEEEERRDGEAKKSAAKKKTKAKKAKGKAEKARIKVDSDPSESEDDDADDPSDACLLYTSPSPRDKRQSRMPSSA